MNFKNSNIASVIALAGIAMEMGFYEKALEYTVIAREMINKDKFVLSCVSS